MYSGHTRIILKLTEGLPAARKFYGSWMEGLSTAQKVDGSGQKIQRPHGNLTEVDGMSHCCTESWWKLMEGFPVTRKVDKVYGRNPGHRNFMEVDEKSSGRTES